MLNRLSRAPLRIGQAATPYGATWTRYTALGDGIGAARTITNAGSITGYVVQQIPSTLALALAGSNVPESSWWLIMTATVTLGDTIRNATDISIIFTIETKDAIGSAYVCRVSKGGTIA